MRERPTLRLNYSRTESDERHKHMALTRALDKAKARARQTEAQDR